MSASIVAKKRCGKKQNWQCFGCLSAEFAYNYFKLPKIWLKWNGILKMVFYLSFFVNFIAIPELIWPSNTNLS